MAGVVFAHGICPSHGWDEALPRKKDRREYRQQLERCGLVASMSRKGNCYDNAAMEAFWSTLKREALEESANWSKDHVRRVIFEYIESIYNRNRLHSSLGYQSPVDFEQQNN